ncbi:MAG: Na+/H+ antiporter subunit E [Candidatus Competibacteraceae bacterium]|nr:Na+/H+ antiporter subunit E [Candidatus Competibacteraceae bacterium]HRX70373.1 Na+/H+ antiporter subunit E [Candidatus Competibacteraceae bacterium]
MLHLIGLWLFCAGLWLILSGYFNIPLLLVFGALSCALVVFIAWRVEKADPEDQPLHLKIGPQAILYWPWLVWQIVLANLDVAKRILDPKLPISPTMIKLKPTQRSEVGQVIYANSITLTPGTITASLSDGVLEVHALTQEAADSLLEGDMDRRVTALERRSTA